VIDEAFTEKLSDGIKIRFKQSILKRRKNKISASFFKRFKRYCGKTVENFGRRSVGAISAWGSKVYERSSAGAPGVGEIYLNDLAVAIRNKLNSNGAVVDRVVDYRVGHKAVSTVPVSCKRLDLTVESDCDDRSCAIA